MSFHRWTQPRHSSCLFDRHLQLWTVFEQPFRGLYPCESNLRDIWWPSLASWVQQFCDILRLQSRILVWSKCCRWWRQSGLPVETQQSARWVLLRTPSLSWSYCFPRFRTHPEWFRYPVPLCKLNERKKRNFCFYFLFTWQPSRTESGKNNDLNKTKKKRYINSCHLDPLPCLEGHKRIFHLMPQTAPQYKNHLKKSMQTILWRLRSKWKFLRLGHGFSEQAAVSPICPAQLWPFLFGGGLVQDLLRALTPPPHVLEHWVQLDQLDQAPSTSPAPEGKKNSYD